MSIEFPLCTEVADKSYTNVVDVAVLNDSSRDERCYTRSTTSLWTGTCAIGGVPLLDAAFSVFILRVWTEI